MTDFSYKTQKGISDIEINEDDTVIIKSFNPNNEWDNVSIHMIQLCGKSIVKTLKNLFESSLSAGIFPED